MDTLKSGVLSSEILKMQSKDELPKVKFEEDFEIFECCSCKDG